MKKVIYDAKAINDEIEILCFSDAHIGSSACNTQAVIECIEYVKEKPNRYIVLNGDLIDNNLKASPGSIFEQEMSPTSQIGWICEKLKPLAKKTIFMTSGNHEDRTNKEVGLSPSQIIASTLSFNDEEFPKRYCEDGAYAFVRIKWKRGTALLTMFALHGNGGGTTLGSKVNKLESLRAIVPANVYLRSHTHEFEYHTGINYTIDKAKFDIREERCYFINTSSFLNYNGSYGAKNGLKPIPIVVPIINVKVERKYHNNKEYHDKNISIKTLEF